MRKGCRVLLLLLCLPWLLPVQAEPGGRTTVVLNADSVPAPRCFGFHKTQYPPNAANVARSTVLEIGRQTNAADKSYTEHATYPVRIPRDDTYYLWARVAWGVRWSDTLTVQFAGRAEVYHLGGEHRNNEMHWVCLSENGLSPDGRLVNAPVALPLRQGSVTMTVISGTRDYRTYIDEFLLTTDRAARPAGIYRSTPNVLAAGSPDRFPCFAAEQPVRLAFKAAAGTLHGPCGMVLRCFIDAHNKIDGSKVLHFHYPQTVCFDAQQGFRHGILGVAAVQLHLPYRAGYYLWARVWWAKEGENELCCTLVKHPKAGSNSGWVDGSFCDQQYGALHWVRCAVSADQQHPEAIPLPDGDLQVNLFAYQYHVKIAQLLLTTDPNFTPRGAYAPSGCAGNTEGDVLGSKQ